MRIFEAYVKKQLVEKIGAMLFFLVVMLYPNFVARAFGIFFIILFGLTSDLRQKRLDPLMSLPFSRPQIFWFEYSFLFLIVTVTFLIGLPFSTLTITTWIEFLRSVTFMTAFYSVVLMATCSGFDNYGAAFLFLLADLILAGIGTTEFGPRLNPYKFISPTHQGNVFMAFAFSIFLLFSAYIIFTKRGGER
ncbi:MULTISPECIES: hypothetical protein [Pseudothermotoga]|uniref:hypothetical protein n=1 Tax=Pseudothermotoga TaxID=1643951 RepID=UPI00041CBB9D|nr:MULTISPECIES: hypothetical protein [Pseudothermotoga]MDI3493948.1 hypothetical protein [Pseudothermotoga sp.]MDK2884526.1 hypothetical protein [Pseudothermotoga sp.]HBJ80493.1 hypothetical protein [Pseudothermotoga sp.]